MKHSILLVDHDVPARSAVAQMVEVLGYHAIGVAHAELALGVLNAVMVDVLLVGWLPDDDLAALVAIARRTQPGLKVVAAFERSLSIPGAPAIDAFIHTPFSLRELKNVLRTLRL